MPLIILSIQTIIFWIITVILYQKRSKITLIPIYAYIAALTIFTHNFSDLGFAINSNGLYFLISSSVFFTTLMFTVLFLYLLEGPRSARFALWTIVATSFFYIGIVYLLGLEVNVANWVQFDLNRIIYYFWSILAIILDILFLAIFWEFLSKFRYLKLVFRVFIVMLGVFVLDSLIFVTGVFGSSGAYLEILRSDILVRFIMSLIAAPVMAYLFKISGFSEEKRSKPKVFWELLNLHSNLESKVLTLEESVKEYEAAEQKLKEINDIYNKLLDSVPISIKILDPHGELISVNKYGKEAHFLTKLSEEEIKKWDFMGDIKEEYRPKVKNAIDLAVAGKMTQDMPVAYNPERSKFVWHLSDFVPIIHNNEVRIIYYLGRDIDREKNIEADLQKRKDELEKINNIMIDRELKMIELKERIKDLEEKNKS